MMESLQRPTAFTAQQAWQGFSTAPLAFCIHCAAALIRDIGAAAPIIVARSAIDIGISICGREGNESAL